LRGRDWAFLGLCLAIGAACLRLGIWQLSRLSERLSHNTAVSQGMSAPPLALPLAESPADLACRREGGPA